MSNPILQWFQAHLGQELTDSPSPLARWLRGIVREAKEGELAVDFVVREDMTNPMGIIHGGAVSAILDEVIGAAVFALHNEFYYTSVNLNVDFLSSAKKGEIITARSAIIRKGRNIIHAECHLYNAGGKLLAKGSSNLLATPIKTPTY